MAFRKLDILRYRISHALGMECVARPKGLRPGMETVPVTEEEFGRRLHRIYSEMNFAWAYRKRTHDERLSRRTVRQYGQFSSVFLSAETVATVLGADENT